MKTFYISDTHFGHANVIKFDDRPFGNVEDMNITMRDNWNNVVSKEDIVYILGDFMWKFKDEDFEFAKSLNGRKRLIKGNHDRCHSTNFKRLFEKISDYEKVKDGEHDVILSHYPMLAYNGSYKGRNIHLYGHVHITDEWDIINKFILENRSEEHPMKMYNVGCMMPWIDYTPRTLDYILENAK